MTKPLALIFYENLLPGSQLTHRLQDLGYRAQTIQDGARVAAEAEKQRPLVVLMDLDTKRASALEIIRDLKAGAATTHIPILAFTGGADKERQTQATAAGASLVAMESGFVAQLPQLLEQVLHVE